MELEKFKLLFFDEDQYILFQHLPKPLIYDKHISDNNMKAQSRRKFDISHMEAFWRKKVDRRQNEILFKKAVDKIEWKKVLDAIDSRLLKMLLLDNKTT